MKKKQSGIFYVLSLVKDERGKLILAMFLAVLSTALSFVPYMVIYEMILALIKNSIAFKMVMFWAVVGIVAIVLRSVFMGLAGICSHVAAFNTLHKVKIKVLKHMSKLNLGFFNENSAGRLKSVFCDDIGRLEDFIAHNTLELASAVVVPVILFIALLILQPILALCMLIPIIIGMGIPMKMMSKYPELTDEFVKTSSDLNATVNEFIKGMPVIKMYNITAQRFSKYMHVLSAYMACWKKMCFISCKPLAITVVILESGILFTLPAGGFMYLNGSISMATYLLFILLTMNFFSSFMRLLTLKMSFMELTSGLTSVQEIMETKPVSNGIKRLSKKGCYGVAFKNVSFNYGQKEALSHVSIDMKPGTLTAFVGASGAGKTTAAQLIGKYWNIDDGEILINGVNIGDFDVESLMDLTAFVFQDVFMLEDTLIENIRMGSDASEDEVIAAAKSAQIHDFIEGLPNSYNTRIGDAGVKLSGGQKQRISIARAILKDAPIVVFDEATSYTDIENEHKIQVALQSLLKGKTTIMIAHRLHTIRNADNIVVFDEGKIVEQGRHNDLMASEGLYNKMWSAYIGKPHTAYEVI